MFRSIFGKYRFLVASIALFLIFDLGVLILNFYLSGQIAEQTERINLAGRQRTLTQQMSKATLYIKAQKLQSWVYQSGLDELKTYYTTFDDTIRAFDKGGQTTSAETNEDISINPVVDAKGREILNNALALWSQFDEAVAPLMVDALITDEEIKPASEFIASNNLAMFAYMNQLTQHFTDESEKQTTFLRTAQVVGISLATINFFIILFHFLRQLRNRDKALALKQHESEQILGTIDEGVFLVDEQLIIGQQHSRYLSEVFDTNSISGRRFGRFLSTYFPKKTANTAVEYVKLYFSKRVNSDLIADINPLKRIKAIVPNGDGKAIEKYLDFSFAKLRRDDDQSAVLVTVKDVSDSIRLEEQSVEDADKAEEQMLLFSEIIKIKTDELDSFMQESSNSYERMNELLKNNKKTDDNFHQMFNLLLREAHKLKGISSAIGFERITNQLHGFEDSVSSFQRQAKQKTLSGRDILPLTIQLKEMYDSIDQIQSLSERLKQYGIDSSAVTAKHATNEHLQAWPTENQSWQDLHRFIQELSEEKQIQVDATFRGFEQAVPKRLSGVLHPIAVQLIRNSFAHGFEQNTTRQKLRKPNSGQILISISHDDDFNYRFTYLDDGRGFDYQNIRNTLIKNGMPEEFANDLNNTALIRHAFSDGFSTQSNVNNLSGRGVGLSLIWEQVKASNGTLKIRSQEGEYTKFIFDFIAKPNSYELSA